MKYLSMVLFLVLAIIIEGCKSTEKSSSQESTPKEMPMNTEKRALLLKEGYQEAILRVNNSKEEGEGCPFLIELNGQLLDPINLKQDYSRFIPKDSITIWIKHQNLRMANRCRMARPINIIDIEGR